MTCDMGSPVLSGEGSPSPGSLLWLFLPRMPPQSVQLRPRSSLQWRFQEDSTAAASNARPMTWRRSSHHRPKKNNTSSIWTTRHPCGPALPAPAASSRRSTRPKHRHPRRPRRRRRRRSLAPAVSSRPSRCTRRKHRRPFRHLDDTDLEPHTPQHTLQPIPSLSAPLLQVFVLHLHARAEKGPLAHANLESAPNHPVFPPRPPQHRRILGGTRKTLPFSMNISALMLSRQHPHWATVRWSLVASLPAPKNIHFSRAHLEPCTMQDTWQPASSLSTTERMGHKQHGCAVGPPARGQPKSGSGPSLRCRVEERLRAKCGFEPGVRLRAEERLRARCTASSFGRRAASSQELRLLRRIVRVSQSTATQGRRVEDEGITMPGLVGFS